MSDISTVFNKIDQKCSNVFLIDENLCLGNSLNIINSNVYNLSSSINSIQTTADYLNGVYTYFSTQSASWVEASTNIGKNHEKWDQDYTTVNTLSSTWTTETVLFYTQMLDIQNWNTNVSTITGIQILNWLNSNFPASNFVENQTLAVYINLYEKYSFDLCNFQTSYYHDCHVPGGSGTLDCTYCPDQPSHGCNHHGGAAGKRGCDNAFDYCSKHVSGGGQISYTCQGYNAKLLQIPQGGGTFNFQLYDQFAVRCQRVRYKKLPNTNTWSPL
jgi:hypothetical protein